MNLTLRLRKLWFKIKRIRLSKNALIATPVIALILAGINYFYLVGIYFYVKRRRRLQRLNQVNVRISRSFNMGFLKLVKLDFEKIYSYHILQKKNQNSVFDFIKKQFCSIPSGLVNYGSNCYLNVLLQVKINLH